MNVRDALVSDPRVVDPGTPLAEVAGLLGRPHVASVLVAEDGRFVGVVTADAVVAAVARREDVRALTAGDLAEADVATIGPDEPLDEAILMLGERDLERLVVVEGGRLLGVLPREGLVRRIAEDEPPPDTDADQGTSV
jgi:CBS domain-containing protein